MNVSRVYVALKILEGLAIGWSATTYVLFILSTGNSLLAANTANVVFMFTIFFFDPLTGKWGDLYGHRKIYLIGLLIFGLGTTTYFFAFTLLGFMFAEFLAGVGRSLMSEALEAWVTNALPKIEASHARTQGESFGKLAGIFSAVGGSLIGAHFGLGWPWIADALTCFVALLLGYTWLNKFPTEPRLNQSLGETISVIDGWKTSWADKYIRFSLGLTFIFSVLLQPINMFWAPVFSEVSGGQTSWLGVISVAINLALALGAWLSRVNEVKRIHFMLMLSGIGVFMLLASQAPTAILIAIFFVLHEVPRGAWRNLMYQFANEHIKPHERAMMNSVRSAMGTLGAAMGLIISGLLTEVVSAREVWMLVSLAIIIYALFIRVRYRWL